MSRSSNNGPSTESKEGRNTGKKTTKKSKKNRKNQSNSDREEQALADLKSKKREFELMENSKRVQKEQQQNIAKLTALFKNLKV